MLKKILFYGFLTLFLGILLLLFIFSTADIPLETLKKKYANEHSRFVQLSGVKMHYRIEGKGDTIVLLHGTAASLHTWDIWTEELKKNYTVVRLDLPAFGLTGADSAHRYDMESYVNTLHEFFQKINLKKCYLVGNSLGGRIAWQYAVRYPKEVQKLILIDAAGYPSTRPRPWVFRLATIPILNSIVRYVTPKFFFERNLKEVYGDDSQINETLLTRYYELNLAEGNRAAFIARAKTPELDNSLLIKNIKCPTLIQWGDADTWIPVENAQRFAKDIAQSELKIYKGLGHVPMEENPLLTVKDAMLFLAK
ncbi:MAG: alpha/beta hydrolase [Cytophagales bacterium]|nr:MAG: alpha/beta hydrolase [Cytophagales bacterium]